MEELDNIRRAALRKAISLHGIATFLRCFKKNEGGKVKFSNFNKELGERYPISLERQLEVLTDKFFETAGRHLFTQDHIDKSFTLTGTGLLFLQFCKDIEKTQNKLENAVAQPLDGSQLGVVMNAFSYNRFLHIADVAREQDETNPIEPNIFYEKTDFLRQRFLENEAADCAFIESFNPIESEKSFEAIETERKPIRLLTNFRHPSDIDFPNAERASLSSENGPDNIIRRGLALNYDDLRDMPIIVGHTVMFKKYLMYLRRVHTGEEIPTIGDELDIDGIDFKSGDLKNHYPKLNGLQNSVNIVIDTLLGSKDAHCIIATPEVIDHAIALYRHARFKFETGEKGSQLKPRPLYSYNIDDNELHFRRFVLIKNFSEGHPREKLIQTFRRAVKTRKVS